MIDFPNSPAVGQITTAPNGTTWRWSGSAWLLGTAASAGGARGVVAYAEVTAIQAGIVGTLVDVTGLTVTFNAVPGRTYRVLASLEILSTVAGDTPQATINTVVGSATMTTARVAQLGTPNWSHQLTPVFVKTGLSGEVSYKVMAGRAAGTGSLTVEARTYRPAFILVEDITYDAGPGGSAQPWNVAWGQVAQITNGTEYGSIGATESAVNSGTFPAIAGRKYQATTQQALVQTVAGDLFFVRAYINSAQALHDLSQQHISYQVFNRPTRVIAVATANPTAACSITFQRMSGTGTASAPNANYMQSVLNIFDVGPITPL